ADVLTELKRRVRPSVATAELDRVAEEMTRARGAQPAFKGYNVGGRVFPRTVCISINDEVVHGIPSEQRGLHEGALGGAAFGVNYEGYFGDSAVTVAVGQVDDEAERLMRVTEDALWAGINEARAGRRLGDLSAAIQEHVEEHGFTIVREFVGHGIGKRLHEE